LIHFYKRFPHQHVLKCQKVAKLILVRKELVSYRSVCRKTITRKKSAQML